DFNFTVCYVEVSMRRSPRNVKIAFSHAGLTHYGGILFFNEFSRMLQLRRFLTRHLRYPRRNHDYQLSQMILSLVYPIILGLDRLETASLLRSNGTFQYLTGLPTYPTPQSLRRFLLQAAPDFREQLHRVNDYMLQHFIHRPDHRSRLILDLDSTIITVFGHQEGAAVGYNPRYRGKRSYDPLLCLEANSSFLWDVELRRGDAGTWAGSEELLACCFHSTPSDIRELRVRADAGFGYGPVLEMLEARPTLFTLERYAYRVWHTNLPLTPAGVWHFYDGRAGMEPRIRELREDYALRKIPTRAFAANALYLEVVRLAYNLVTAFQRTCLTEEWQSLTLSKLRHRLFWLPGELTRPRNRPILRFANPPLIKKRAAEILHQIHRLKPLEG
ncbi:MAG: hypothetical protein DMG53_29010, partial [Acidobacteria bacterium]